MISTKVIVRIESANTCQWISTVPGTLYMLKMFAFIEKFEWL